MIYIDRSNVPAPEILHSTKVRMELEGIEKLLARGVEHLEQLRFKFRPEIYNRTKEILLELFHGKCAYCEMKIGFTARSDVEHFRPRQRAEDFDGRVDPGHYAWLAYDWDNLLITCPDCNRFGKASLFPVIGKRANTMATVAECRKKEKAMILDPCFDHPERHIDFDQKGICVPLSERGRVTIDVIGLNRPDLVAEREQVWQKILSEFMLLFVDPNISDKERVDRIEEMTSPRQEFSALIRSALNHAMKRLSEKDITKMEAVDPSTAAIDEEILEKVKSAPEVLEPKAIKGALMSPQFSSKTPAAPKRPTGLSKLPPLARQRIRRVVINNFKAIETLDLKLKTRMPGNFENVGALMLLGENATGKSTILEAIAMTLIGTEQLEWLNLDSREFIRRSKGWDAPVEEEDPASVSVHFDNGHILELYIDPRKPGFQGNSQPATVLLGYGPRRFFPTQRRLRRSTFPGERIRTIFDPLALVPNPRSWLMNVSNARFNAVVRALRHVLLLPDEALVVRPPRGQRSGKQILFEIQGETAPLDKLSDGYKTIVATSVDIMREMLAYWPDLENAGGVVMIDELEAHLHPRWKMRIARSLRDALPNVQFLMTTHDPICLRGMKDGEVQVMYREAGAGIDRVRELPNVQGLSVEQLFTSDYFGLHSTEDPELESDLARYVGLASKGDRSPLEERELADQRRVMHGTLTLGSTPEERVIQEAISEYSKNRRETSQTLRPKLKKEAIEKVLDFWDSLRDKDSQP